MKGRNIWGPFGLWETKKSALDRKPRAHEGVTFWPMQAWRHSRDWLLAPIHSLSAEQIFDSYFFHSLSLSGLGEDSVPLSKSTTQRRTEYESPLECLAEMEASLSVNPVWACANFIGA